MSDKELTIIQLKLLKEKFDKKDQWVSSIIVQNAIDLLSIPVELPSSVAEPNQSIFTIREVERMLADQRLSCMKQRYYNRYNGVKKMEEAILNAPPPQEFIDKIIVKIP